MKRRFAGLTDTGIQRSVNQDDYHIDPEGRFFIVADGMGGHAGGQDASRIAAQMIQGHLEEYWETQASEALLEKAIIEANQAILDDQIQNPQRADMGTTVVVVMFHDDRSWCAHVGDSRIYRLRDRQLQQMSEDQTWVARALKMGDLTEDEARIHPWRHVLSQCLGRKDLYGVEVRPLDLQAGDRLLLCSDGLTEEVQNSALRNLLLEYDNCEEAAEALVEEAKKNGGSDNITVVIIAQD
ncbi:MAG: Stp1/IreP family PP2C-type Ser/Thr phosphatase [Jaaginema sp. PMC 1079.18]|nr:Stp1/IreP family PP2C-type Ser/Thr phosphatase [Jaaginema sp. PMC 1080.18]MEC4850375.1 Stp1/IreP family PP2C-type Ser/Thr phosphatase [Jaaginema sp. PMC 1079.18]MEC4864995.1 Stp1/IreP family PP2C-type Ser/Thr phosphatase [Jaaginema sp. PMC 1078.18]